MRIAGYDTHPAADLFPLLGGQDLQDLAANIKTQGLLDAIVLFAEGGKRLVLDGRNRLRACELAGVEPRFEFWAGEGSPVEWVVSRNLHRRHLDASQRAMVAAGLVEMFEKEAAARRRATQNNDAGIAVSANLRSQEPGKATAKAAAAVNVSPRLVESALKVVRAVERGEAKAEVVEAVKRGEVAVSAAAKALAPPKLPASKTSKAPKASPLYSLLLVMPTADAAAVSKQLHALGFETVRHPDGKCDAEMRLGATNRKRTA